MILQDERKLPVRSPLITVGGVKVKLECVQPTGSIKDRIATYILDESERLGLLRKGMRIVEATSGNTGIALAYHGTRKGYPVTIVMPEHMTDERKATILSLGAELVLCSKEGGFLEAAAIRDEMASTLPGIFNPDQFANPLNAEAHRIGTGAELIEQAGHPFDAFVAGVGTGGTLIGVAQALREQNPNTRIVAVEPAEAAVMSGGPNGPHGIYGIGDGFLPDLASDGKGGLHPLIDEVQVVSTAEATEAARHLASAFGICVGVSSGANFVAAQRLRERFEDVATVFADGASKYTSCGLKESALAACPYSDDCKQSVLFQINDW